MIGTVEQLDQDFPNLWGKYTLTENSIDSYNHIKNYIQYSIKADILMNEDEQQWLEFIATEESKFGKLIESEGWKLIDEKNDVHKILVPNFCDQNEIVWRWNF